MRLQDPRRHPQHRLLDGVGVGDDAGLDVAGAPGHVHQPGRDQSTRARLPHRHPEAPAREQRRDDLRQRTAIGAEQVVSQHLGELPGRPVENRVGRRLRIGPGRQVQLHQPRRRQHRGLHPRLGLPPSLVDRLGPLLDKRLPAARHAQHPPIQPPRCRPRGESALHQRGEHRLQLAGRPRQQDDHPAVVLHPESRRGTPRVVERDRARRHPRLTSVVGRHRPPPAGETGLQPLDDGRVFVQRPIEHLRDGLPRQVILGRAEPAADHEQLDPPERGLHGRRQVLDPVADNRLAADDDAKLVESGGQEQRVRVGAERGQQLRSHRDDLGHRERLVRMRGGRRFHRSSLANAQCKDSWVTGIAGEYGSDQVPASQRRRRSSACA